MGQFCFPILYLIHWINKEYIHMHIEYLQHYYTSLNILSIIHCLYSVFLSDKDHMDVLKQHIIDEVPHKWKKIATALGLSYNKMEAIESENRKNHNRLLTVFGLWLRGSHGTGEKSRTLQTLHDALVDSDCRPEAENILKHFEGIILIRDKILHLPF